MKTKLIFIALILFGLTSCEEDKIKKLEWTLGADGGLEVIKTLTPEGISELEVKITKESFCIIAHGIELTLSNGGSTFMTEVVESLPYSKLVSISPGPIEIKTKVVNLDNNSACKWLGNATCMIYY